MKKQCDEAVSFLAAVPLSLLYWRYAVTAGEMDFFSAAAIGNIKSYIIMILLFTVLYLSAYYVVSRLPYPLELPYTTGRLLLLALFLVILCGVYPLWEKELGQMCRQPGGIVLGFLLIVLLTLGMLGRCRDRHSNKKIPRYLQGIIVMGGILWGIAAAEFNTYSGVFVYKQTNLHHSSAYLDAIYNVLRKLPYSGNLTDQYGHYGLFFLPLKFLGLNTKTVGILMGILAAFVFVLSVISLCRLVESNGIRCLVVFSISMVYISCMAQRVYWQTFPHRQFFPALTLFLISLCAEKGLTKKRYVIINVVMMLAVLWNLESGIVCVLAWCFYAALEYIYRIKHLRMRSMILLVVVLAGEIAFALLGAWAIVNGYNLWCGGKALGFFGFMGAVTDNAYMQWLTMPLSWGNEMYIHKMMFFLGSLAVVMVRMRRNGNGEEHEKICIMAGLTALGLGLMTYSINRPAAGERIIDLFLMILFGFWAEQAGKCFRNIRGQSFYLCKICKVFVGIYAMLLLLICAGTGIDCGGRMIKKIQMGAYDYRDFQHFTKKIKKNVPPDTWAKGEGTTAVYMELGWDKQTRDFDVFSEEDQKSIRKQECILITEAYYDKVPENYRFVRSYSYHGIVYGCYQRK